jgi:transcriptional regulator with XRE-family HTH domain
MQSPEEREVLVGELICEALRRFLEQKQISSYELSRLTGIPSSNLRRMTTNQEPRPSQLDRIERAMKVPFGTIMRMAGLYPDIDTETTIGTDDRLHPTVRVMAMESYQSWLRISEELSTPR